MLVIVAMVAVVCVAVMVCVRLGPNYVLHAIVLMVLVRCAQLHCMLCVKVTMYVCAVVLRVRAYTPKCACLPIYVCVSICLCLSKFKST